MRRSAFYAVVAGLIILNGYLLSKPNLLGKIGLIVYKYYYLRTFPRTLLTVGIVCGLALLLMELFNFLVTRRIIGLALGRALMALLIALSFAQLVKTGMDFTAWTYSHTGLRFRLGAFMLPTVVILIFTYGWMRLPNAIDLLVRKESTQSRESTPKTTESAPISRSADHEVNK